MPRLPLCRCLPLAAVLLLAGCDREQINNYSVPKPTAPEAKVRLAAAVFERGDDLWFFKLLGPLAEVKKHEPDFEVLLHSVHFPKDGKEAIVWTLPKDKGWEQKAGGGEFRHATIQPDPKAKDPAALLTVSKLPNTSKLPENVNRWCRLDLGLKPLRPAEVDEIKKDFTTTAGDKGVLVALDGPGAPKKGDHPPMGGDMDKFRPPLPRDGGGAGAAPRKTPAAPKELTYTTPAGWVETGPRGGFVSILTAFDVGGKAAEATVLALGGTVGGDVDNVNRWRGQVGLKPITADDLKRDPPRDVKVHDAAGKRYELTGPARRMLLVVVRRGGQTWYLKLMGDAAVVARNREAFDSFVQSVKFTGAAE